MLACDWSNLIPECPPLFLSLPKGGDFIMAHAGAELCVNPAPPSQCVT